MPSKKRKATKKPDSETSKQSIAAETCSNPFGASISSSGGGGLLSSIFGDVPKASQQQKQSSSSLFSASNATKLERLTQDRVKQNKESLVSSSTKRDALSQRQPSSRSEILKQRRDRNTSNQSKSTIASITVNMPDIEENADDNDTAEGELRLFAGQCSSVFRQQGVLLLKTDPDDGGKLFPDKLLSSLSEKAKSIERKICKRLDKVGSKWRVPGDQDTCNEQNLDMEREHHFKYHEVASRCLGRLDVRYGMDKKPFNDEHVIDNLYIMSVVRGVLGKDAKLVYAGLIFSFSNSADQPWHQDGGKLFEESEFPRGNAIDLPPYALNVFVPLEDVIEDLGPTEFLVQSHLQRKTQELNRLLTAGTDIALSKNEDVKKKTAATSMDLIGPTLKCGDALFYDYRVCHRGTRNLSSNERTRPMLYLMYARPWFHEHLNFGEEKLFAGGDDSSY